MSLYDPPIIATGGDTVQDINGNRIHTFTTVGTSSFVVTRGGPVEVLVVAGGGGGGGVFISFHPAGGGGAGELIYSGNYSVSPGSISVTVGEGGLGGSNNTPTFQTSTNGGNSVFGAITAQGGGRGGDSRGGGGGTIGGNGGSGGGAGRFSSIGGSSTKTIGYGNSGGASVLFSSGGGGGGAGGVGLDSYGNSVKTPGGSGLSYKISGSSVTYAAGGTGGERNTTANGSVVPANTGRGGNGASVASSIVWGVDTAPAGSNGGSGIVIVRYPLGTVLTLRDGLSWGYYTGYFNDDVNFFTGAPSVSGIVTSIPSINAGTNGYVPANQSWSNYSVQWTGWFLSNYTGTWTFYTNSDDASYLWIGPNATSGFTVANSTVNNAGLHGMVERSGTASLVAGQYYPIRIQFGESGSGDNMIVSFENPVLTKTTNGQGFFYPALTPGIAGPWGIFTATPNGLTAAQAATNALALRQGYPGYGDGVYWINCGGVPKQTYCLMDSKWDGGGWMLIMKAAQGSTFNWNSTHWTTTSTLNPTDTTTTVADAKFDVFNSVPVTDVMAVWPASDVGAGNTGGSLTVSDGWVWLVKNWYTGAITPLAGFQIDRDATPADIFSFSGFSKSSPIWSYQSGTRAHVFGSGAHIAGPDTYITRWGFLWNNEPGTTSTQDAFAGIGLNTPSSSGGDFWFWEYVDKKGFNRNIAWLMYGR